MKVLVVYAHPVPTSFNHAILESFTKGLKEVGHEFEVVDLHAIKFDPILKPIELGACITEDMSEWLMERLDLRKMVLYGAGGPIQRFIMKRWMRDKSLSDIARFIHKKLKKPKDVLEHQEKVAKSDAIALISPTWWNNFPTILKGWIERVFSYGFAYALTEKGWLGDVEGRIPLLKLKKALIISTLFFKEEAYKNIGLKEAMTKSIDEWGFKYPGVQEVEHVYFHALYAASDETRKGWLEQAYRLGKEF